MKQITLSERIIIEAGLCSGKSMRKISEDIGKCPETVSREIRANRTFIRGSFYLNNDCRYARMCVQKNLCPENYCSIPCVKCRYYKCSDFCPRYMPSKCSVIEQPPYVCNRCSRKDKCSKNRYVYSAKLADAAASRRRSDSRRGVHLTAEQLDSLDSLVSKQVKKGQPLSHIYAEHEAEMPVSLRTLYNYIDGGILSVRNIDLRRKVRYKPRKRKKQVRVEGDQFAYRYEHTYEDYKKFIEGHPNCSVVQMDTVVGTRSKGQRILTMLFVKSNIMLMQLIPNGKAQTVVDFFDSLLNILDMPEFKSLFTVILTDNGPEFRMTDYLEYAPYTGEQRCRVFYCDPMASWQKAEIEKNHEYTRYVIPKGKSLDGYTDEDITLLMNHINSTKRMSLGGRSPYEMVAEGDENMKWLMQIMGMDAIPADDVHLMPDLLIR